MLFWRSGLPATRTPDCASKVDLSDPKANKSRQRQQGPSRCLAAWACYGALWKPTDADRCQLQQVRNAMAGLRCARPCKDQQLMTNKMLIIPADLIIRLLPILRNTERSERIFVKYSIALVLRSCWRRACQVLVFRRSMGRGI